MRRIYTVCLALATPFLLLRLYFLGFRNRGYRQRWWERLGYLAALPETGARIWVHAVSVGEVQVASVLIRALRRHHPGLGVVLTTTTPTGATTAARLLGSAVLHRYLPLDLPGAMTRFLERVRPRYAVLIETELWPNLLHCCKRRGIPVVLANARLSPRSYARYRGVPGLSAEMLANIRVIAAQSGRDAERFIALGATPGHVIVAGNLKFDAELPEGLLEAARDLRAQMAPGRPVWIAASTHEGEEARVLRAFESVRDIDPRALLLLAPRHPERCDAVHALCRARGFKVTRRGAGMGLPVAGEVFLIDTLGELPLFYACSDVAFVGGSLVTVGGHNPLEPAAVGVPVLTGPCFFNFAPIFEALLAAGAAWRVEDPSELGSRVIDLLGDPLKREMAGAAGRTVVAAHRGAAGRLVAMLSSLAPPLCEKNH